MLMLPVLAAVGIVLVVPSAISVFQSVTSSGRFVGLTNFREVFEDPFFFHALENNLILLISVPLRIVLGLAFTGLLYRKMFGTRLYEMLIFLPFIPSIAAMGVLFIFILNAAGPLNGLLRGIGLASLAQPWLTSPNLTMWSIMGVVLWTQVGFTTLLFSARLLSVDRDLFNASFVDGASWWKTYFHVALPELRGTIEFVTILSVIQVFSFSFAYVFVLSEGANNPSEWIIETYIYNKEFLAGLEGLASAVAVLLLIAALGIAVYRYSRVRQAIT
jgi:ABC-type sugar transport system permease subunit